MSDFHNSFIQALVLCKYFENTEEFPVGFFLHKKVIELGAGTGCVGLILSRLGGKVTITDQKQMLPLIHHNAEINHLEHKVKIVEFNWGENTPLLDPPYDIVVLSDVIAACYSDSYQALTDTLWWLTETHNIATNTQTQEPSSQQQTSNTSTAQQTTSSPSLQSNMQPVIIMSYEKRSFKEVEFFQLLSKKFIYQKVGNSKLDPVYQCDDIGIFIIKRNHVTERTTRLEFIKI